MSAKHLHIITDENKDMHKQLGCLNGLFQIFRHQNFMTGRRISSQGKKILPPGERGNSGKEPQSSTMQEAQEKNNKDGVKKRERTSVESSSSSFSFSSSSYSSTLSSNDCNRIAKSAPSITGHNTLSKPQSHVVPKKQTDHTQNIGKTPEFSVKIKAKSEGKNPIMQHVDSPRPQQVSKPLITRISAHDRSSRVTGRDRNSRVPPKDAPRFSHDERESRDKWKSAVKLKELPRFSLDSRESSIRSAAYEPMSNSLLEGFHQRNDQQLSSIMAKLMGLEAWEKSKPISTSSLRKVGENNHNQNSDSPTLAPKNVSSPKLRNINSSAKPNPMFQLESQRKPKNLYPSVYAQIEMRLTGLEFKKSGKDLRALKQILEAMQIAKASVEDQKDVNFYKQSHISNDSPSTLITPTIKGNNSSKKNKISIAIARPAKGVQKPKKSVFSPSGDTKKELITRKNQLRESSQHTFSPMDKRNSVLTYKSERTREIPRMQNNKHWVEKKFHPITLASEASTPRTAVDRHHTETLSLSSKIKPKSRVSEISGETRPLSHKGDAFSAQSQNNLSTNSQNDKVTSTCRSEVAARLDEFRSKFETKPVALEKPSPVSVLDTVIHVEESPSPVKKLSSTFTDEENLSSDEAESDPVGPVNIVNSTTPDLVSKFDRENRKHIKHSNEKANAYSIASLCENKNPMHRYVAEILSASGLFKDLEPSLAFTQLHPSSRLINPYLFHILEQSKSKIGAEDDEKSMGKINQSKLHEKIHRKLIFDTTDEILVHILISAFHSDLCISTNKLGFRSLTGNKLLEKIYSDMIHLETNLECSLPYEDNAIYLEIPELVLDIERLIFKDLICEIVRSEAGLPSRLNKRRRQLFNN